MKRNAYISLLATALLLGSVSASATAIDGKRAAAIRDANSAVLCYLATQSDRASLELTDTVNAELQRREAACEADTIAAGETRYANLERKQNALRLAKVSQGATHARTVKTWCTIKGTSAVIPCP
jgi:hypothetical protein